MENIKNTATLYILGMRTSITYRAWAIGSGVYGPSLFYSNSMFSPKLSDVAVIDSLFMT